MTTTAIVGYGRFGAAFADLLREHGVRVRAVDPIHAVPEGMAAASLTDLFPLSLNYSSNDVYVEGRPGGRGANAPYAMVASVEQGYFDAMGIPLVAGRPFSERDAREAPRSFGPRTFLSRCLP